MTKFTSALRNAVHNTFRRGKGTRDLSGPSGLTTEAFVAEVREEGGQGRGRGVGEDGGAGNGKGGSRAGAEEGRGLSGPPHH